MFYLEEELFGKFDSTDFKILYAFLLVAAIVAYRLVQRSKVVHKFEVFCLVFYLLTGELNQIFIISLPGSAFDLQPIRLLFFVFVFFLFRKIAVQNDRTLFRHFQNTPAFMLVLYCFLGYVIFSQGVHVSDIGLSKMLLSVFTAVKFLVLIYALQLLCDRETIKVLAKTFILGAIFTSVLSLVQIFIDQEFLRIGDYRPAFGTLLRANGMFSAEYHNSYFIIAAIIWLWVTEQNRSRMFFLFILFASAVFCTFHRMSWLVLSLVTFVYFVWIDKIAVEKLVFLGLGGIAALLLLFIIFQSEIMNSSLVRERITDTVGGRAGYYAMVLENIGDKPIFGYGDEKNDVYYYSMLRVTGDRDRATGRTGGIHNGYLSALFYYGVPAFIFFTAFVIMAIIYFARLTYSQFSFAIPLMYCLLFFFGNLTNELTLEKYPGEIFAIFLGIGLGLRHNKDVLA